MPAFFVNTYSKTYNASPFSKAWCIWVLFSVFVILIPIFAAYATEGIVYYYSFPLDLWNRIQIYYEQPIVEYSGQYLLFTYDKGGESKFYSSFSDLVDEYGIGGGTLVSGVSFSVTPYTNTETLKNDKFTAELSFSVPKLNILQNTKLMIFLNYALNEKAKLLMTSMCLIDINTPIGTSGITASGELLLKQKSPVGSTSIPSRLYYDNIFVEDFSPYDTVEIFKHFHNRNFTTFYKYDSVIKIPETESTTDAITMTFDITIPKYQKVIYIPSIYQNLKEVWIQYLFIFIPIYFLVSLLLLFILKNKVFPCSVVNDLPQTSKLSS